MDKFQLKSQFSENITKFGSQLNHIWEMSMEMNANYCNKNILVKISQINLYCIQITKHTSSV